MDLKSQMKVKVKVLNWNMISNDHQINSGQGVSLECQLAAGNNSSCGKYLKMYSSAMTLFLPGTLNLKVNDMIGHKQPDVYIAQGRDA